MRSSMANVAAFLVLVSFSFTYSLLCFHANWAGDIYVYVAAISEVFRDYPYLLHEAGQQPARESIAFSPYLIGLSLLGESLALSPYEVLQWAGVVNCILFPAAAVYLFASICPDKNALISAAFFLLTVIFVRGANYSWSSELSAETLATIQAYPSFFAWSLAMLCFGLCHRLIRSTTIIELALLGILVWLVFLTHNLTGSWVVLIVSFYASAHIALSLRNRMSSSIFGAFACLIVVGIALLATLAWPYSSVLGNLQIVAVHEYAPFSGRPLRSFPFLYVLSVPAYYWCWRHSRPLAIVLICGFGVTLAAYGLLRVISDFFERYVFFLAFFAQVLIAAVLTDNIDNLISSPHQKLFDMSRGQLGRGFIFSMAFTLVLILSAATRSYSAIRLSPDSRAVFEDRFPRLVSALSEADIVAACPTTRLTLFLFSKTGARFVLSFSSQRGETKAARQADLTALFHDGSSRNSVDTIIQRYGITKALVGPGCSANPYFGERLTQVVAENGWSIYSVAGAARTP
jgi:hypothetical protein